MTTASPALRVRFSPGSGSAVASALLFRKTNNDPFEVFVPSNDSNQVRVRSHVNKPTNAFGSFVDIALTPGTPTYPAATRVPGLRQYYVNGVLVNTDICTFPLSQPLSTDGSDAFQVGPACAGLAVTLDNAVLGQGDALTRADITNLSNLVVHPGGITASNIVRQVSPDGLTGTAAVNNPPGLAALGPNGLSATTVSTPRRRTTVACSPPPLSPAKRTHEHPDPISSHRSLGTDPRRLRR